MRRQKIGVSCGACLREVSKLRLWRGTRPWMSRIYFLKIPSKKKCNVLQEFKDWCKDCRNMTLVSLINQANEITMHSQTHFLEILESKPIWLMTMPKLTTGS